MTQTNALDRVAECGVVPVIALDDAELARPLAKALLDGGLPVAEITFRTDAAEQAMRIMAGEFPRILVGAGTILTPEQVERAVAAGCRFGVSPGFNARVVRRATELGMPFLPGVATATDIEAALEAGCRVMKFFPASDLGGPSMIKALSSPYRHTGIRFVPLGGVNTRNLAEYLALDTVAACGGTWLAKKDTLAAGDWPAITAACREAVAIVAKARGR